MQNTDLCNININCYRIEDLLTFSKDTKILVTVNAEAIVKAQKDDKLRELINGNIASIDGQIPLWLFKSKYPNVKIKKISGSDLIYSLPQYAAQNNLRVFLLGGKDKSNSGAVRQLREIYPNLNILGFSPPFSPYPFTKKINSEILSRLSDFKPDILFVGFGMGKQELWEVDNLSFLNHIGCKLVIGCGGSFEFASGMIKRAPKIIQNVGLEGLWRLLQEFKWFRIKRLLLSTKIFYYYFRDYNKK